MDVLIVDDEQSIRTSTSIAIEAEGHYAETADGGRVAELKMQEGDFDLVFLDLRLGDENGLDVLDFLTKRYPRVPVVIFTAHASIESAVEATRRGAIDYLEKPFTPEQVRAQLVKAEKALRTQKQIAHLETEVEELRTEASSVSPEPRFESEDPAMHGAMDVLFRAAATPASILLLGESGTGKSLVAKVIHSKSHLRQKPFVTVSCPSLSRELLESELFGHVKGAFTGAVKDKWGKVHAANGGTLFLDEIGELPAEIQPKLLRLLQEREYERVGETKVRTADVRIVAATNRDLKKEVETGHFREDLYYRLNVIAVELPPLRARGPDVVSFAKDYLAFFARQAGRPAAQFTEDALAAIARYRWPGNLRELRNVVERAVILSADGTVEAKDLPAAVGGGGTDDHEGHEGHDHVVPGADVTLEALENEHIRRVLARAPSIHRAAETLGIDQATLYRKRKRMGLL